MMFVIQYYTFISSLSNLLYEINQYFSRFNFINIILVYIKIYVNKKASKPLFFFVKSIISLL